MILNRNEAIKLASFVQMVSLTPEKKSVKVEDALAEAELLDASETDANMYLRKYLEKELASVKNSYIRQIIEQVFSHEISIKGRQPLLYPCFCCDYKTIEERGDYCICEVCYWEDDGVDQEERFSSPNKMTLREGRENFELYGVCKESLLKVVEDDRTLRYDS